MYSVPSEFSSNSIELLPIHESLKNGFRLALLLAEDVTDLIEFADLSLSDFLSPFAVALGEEEASLDLSLESLDLLLDPLF